MEISSCNPSRTLTFEAAPRFLENISTPDLLVFIFCKLRKLQNPTAINMVIHKQSLKLVSEILYTVTIVFSCT
jgi:hypothetical protein